MPAQTLTLTFSRTMLRGLIPRLIAYAKAQPDRTYRQKLIAAAAKFDGWLAAPGDSVVCEAPWGSWGWLANQVCNFDSGSFGAHLCATLGRLQVEAEASSE